MDLLWQALVGAIGSSPVALVLVWRLKVADDNLKKKDDRIAMLTDDHNKFMKNLAGVED